MLCLDNPIKIKIFNKYIVYMRQKSLLPRGIFDYFLAIAINDRIQSGGHHGALEPEQREETHRRIGATTDPLTKTR